MSNQRIKQRGKFFSQFSLVWFIGLLVTFSFLTCDNAGSTRQGESEIGKTVDSIIDTTYASITFSEGSMPNLDRYRLLFMPNARFVRVRKDGTDPMDLEGFISSYINRVKAGEFKAFHESEIARKTMIFGNIAQVFSVYKKSFRPDDPGSYTRGINGIQLFHDSRRWWVSSVIWQDETENHPIPEEYLKN